MAKALHPARPEQSAAGEARGDIRFDVAELPPARRREAFAAAIDAAYYLCDTSFSVDELQRGRLSGVDVGPVRAGYGDFEPLVLRRTATLARRQAGDFILVPIPLNGRMLFSQRGRESTLRERSFACILTGEAYTYRQTAPLEFLSLRIDAGIARDRVPFVEDLAAQAFSGHSGTAALFLDYTRAFCRNAAGFDRRTGETAVGHLLDLFALAMTATGRSAASSSEHAVREAQRHRILGYVDSRLGDPTLGLASVSRDLGLSERYIQGLLDERSESLAGIVRARRIAEACRLLSDPAGRSRSIAAIAYRLGFSDPAYFSRIFRKEMGMSPTAFREGG